MNMPWQVNYSIPTLQKKYFVSGRFWDSLDGKYMYGRFASGYPLLEGASYMLPEQAYPLLFTLVQMVLSKVRKSLHMVHPMQKVFASFSHRMYKKRFSTE